MRFALIITLFVVSLLLPFLPMWWKMRRWGLSVRVVVDPDDPTPAAICGYLVEIARRLDARPERMRIVFDGRNTPGRAIGLELEPDRALRVSVEGHRPKRVDLRGRWIADHPVPLSLTRTVLYVEPVDANRFRMMRTIPFEISPIVYVLCSILATIGLVRLSPEMLAPVLGLSCGCALVSSFGNGFRFSRFFACKDNI